MTVGICFALTRTNQVKNFFLILSATCHFLLYQVKNFRPDDGSQTPLTELGGRSLDEVETMALTQTQILSSRPEG
jgi:hypothetical protein